MPIVLSHTEELTFVSMDAYIHEALLKQRQQQQQQQVDCGLSPIGATGGFDFTSFSHLAQAAAAGGVNPAAAVVGKQAVLAAGIAQDYFDEQRWKERQVQLCVDSQRYV